MSGNNLARKVQRSLLYRGKLSQGEYEAFRKSGRNRLEDRMCEIEDPINRDRRARKLREVTVRLHPTKGFRIEARIA